MQSWTSPQGEKSIRIGLFVIGTLLKSRAVTQQETDDARYKLASDQQAVRATESQARAQLAKLDGNPNIGKKSGKDCRQRCK